MDCILIILFIGVEVVMHFHYPFKFTGRTLVSRTFSGCVDVQYELQVTTRKLNHIIKKLIHFSFTIGETLEYQAGKRAAEFERKKCYTFLFVCPLITLSLRRVCKVSSYDSWKENHFKAFLQFFSPSKIPLRPFFQNTQNTISDVDFSKLLSIVKY